MNPLFVSAAFGLVKGLAERPGQRSARLDFGTHVVAPMVEEAVFRAAPARAGALGHLAAFAFAADHVRAEQHTAASGIWRLAETFAGGLLYQRAYARFGFLGAVAAHALHNLGVSAGRSIRAPADSRRSLNEAPERPPRRRSPPPAPRRAKRPRGPSSWGRSRR